MDIIIEAFLEALNLFKSLDPEIISIAIKTFQVTGYGLIIAILFGLPIGVALGLSRPIPIRGCLIPIIYTGMGLPPVLVGLFIFLLLSKQGPLGELQWLFTTPAMVMAQAILSLPIIVGLTMTAVQSIDPMLKQQVLSLGATPFQLAWTTLSEARLGIFAAIITAFGSIISEVGAVMLVGGNIQGETRVLTTAIVLETRRGNFSFALALGIILLSLTFLANFFLYRLQTNGVRSPGPQYRGLIDHKGGDTGDCGP
jgi:tungstate transport system permease protein